MYKIACDVCADDWTAERAIIASDFVILSRPALFSSFLKEKFWQQTLQSLVWEYFEEAVLFCFSLSIKFSG